MKHMIVGTIKFFKNMTKYRRIEDGAKQELFNDYRRYQISKDKIQLLDLVRLVDFCNRVGINGETEAIKAEIKLEWEKFISSNEEIKREE